MFEVILAMTALIGMIGLLAKINRDDELKRLEANNKAQLALEAQRYEKIKEILTDGVIDGQPAAIEVLKPLVQVITDQMRGDDALQLKKLENKHELDLLKAQNQPFQSWMDEVASLRDSLVQEEIDFEEFETMLEAMTSSAERVFGVSLRAVPAIEEAPALPEATKE